MVQGVISCYCYFFLHRSIQIFLTICYSASFVMWDLSSLSRARTHALALEGGVLTTGPPGKSPELYTLNE